MTNNFLFELGTEELPPKMLPKLSSDLEVAITEELNSKNLNYRSILSFATPRRLALLRKEVPGLGLPKMLFRVLLNHAGLILLGFRNNLLMILNIFSIRSKEKVRKLSIY